MKKVFLAAALLLGAAGMLPAQSLIPGIKGGLTVADVSNSNGDSRISGHAGLFLHHTINSRWCFQPEILYSGMGQRYETGGEDLTLALSYIQVPLMIQYYPVKQLYLEAGPQLGILTSAKVKGDNDFKAEVDDDYRKADFGLNLGIGVAATPRFGFYGRYLLGLTDISDNSRTHYNRGGQIGAYVRLR